MVQTGVALVVFLNEFVGNDVLFADIQRASRKVCLGTPCQMRLTVFEGYILLVSDNEVAIGKNHMIGFYPLFKNNILGKQLKGVFYSQRDMLFAFELPKDIRIIRHLRQSAFNLDLN